MLVLTEICYSCKDYEWDHTPDITNSTTIITNIYIFLDTMWPYYSIVDYVSYIVQRLNINPYASAVTLLSAWDASIIVNTTNYLSEFYINWNATTHNWHSPGFKLPVVLSTVRDLVELVMNGERDSSTVGGQSIIALLVPSPVAYVTEEDYNYSMRFLAYLNTSMPDLHFLYYAGGAMIRFKDFVSNPNEDLFPLSLDWGVRETAQPVVKRLRRVPRRLVNSGCGADWNTPISISNRMMQYASLGSINFYRMVPNYFFGSASMRYLKIQAASAVTFTVCTSRSIRLPFNSGDTDPAEQDCSQTAVNGFSYDLTDACTGYDTLQQCPPLYLSVQAQDFADTTQVTCKDAACQTPDQAQYIVFVNNLGCNGVGSLSVSLVANMLTLFLISIVL